jgi:hypothetical protein
MGGVGGRKSRGKEAKASLKHTSRRIQQKQNGQKVRSAFVAQ